MHYSLFDSLSDAILIMDGQRRIAYLNDAAAHLVGVPRDRIKTGTFCYELFKFDDATLFCMPEGRWDGKTTLPRGVTYQAPAGKQGHAEIQLQTVPDSSPQHWMIRLRVSENEQTVRQRPRNELDQKEDGKMSLVGEFVAGISHELNNPLAIVINSVEIIVSCLDDPTLDVPMIKELAGYLQTSCTRILKLSQHLKSLGRNSVSLQNLVKQPPRQAIDEAIAFTNHLTQKSGIQVFNHIAADLPEVSIDAPMIEQIAINLIRNSYDELRLIEGEATGRIEIHGRFDEPSQAVWLEFIDNGPGISLEIQDRLFTPFATTKSARLGTGLGLSICSSLAEMHGGSLTPGLQPAQGASFVLALPTVPPLLVTRPENQSPLGAHILVLHPSAWLRNMLCKTIGRFSAHHPAEAAPNVEALAWLECQSWDLVLADARTCADSRFSQAFARTRAGRPLLIEEVRPLSQSAAAGAVPRAFTSPDLLARISKSLGKTT